MATKPPFSKSWTTSAPPRSKPNPRYGDTPLTGLEAFTPAYTTQADPTAFRTALARFLAARTNQPAAAGPPGGAQAGGSAGGVSGDPFASAHASALAEIAAAQAQWEARNAGLKAEQQQVGAQTLAGLQQHGQAELEAYRRAVNPVTADLAAQGFSAAPIQQRAVLDEQRLIGDQSRNATLSQRFSQIDNRSFSDREAAAQANSSAARQNLALQMAALRAEAAGGGGGGGGYGGGGGGGAASALTAGQGALMGYLADSAQPDFRLEAQYTGPGSRFVQKMLFRDNKEGGVHLNRNLSNMNEVIPRIIAGLRARNKDVGAFKAQVVKPLRKALPRATAAATKRRGARVNLKAQGVL